MRWHAIGILPKMNPRHLALDEIQAMVDAETNAWNNLDADALVALFHPDMVWVWPPDAQSHDPETWVMPMGRFDAGRWKDVWNRLFTDYTLAHNRRKTVRIEVTEQLDGGFAVVDVDTLWITSKTNPSSTGKAAPARYIQRSRAAGSSSTTPACCNTLRPQAIQKSQVDLSAFHDLKNVNQPPAKIKFTPAPNAGVFINKFPPPQNKPRLPNKPEQIRT